MARCSVKRCALCVNTVCCFVNLRARIINKVDDTSEISWHCLVVRLLCTTFAPSEILNDMNMKALKYMMMTAVAVVVLGSCASKKDLVAAQQKLEECQDKNNSLGKEYLNTQVQMTEYKTKAENLQAQLDDKNAQ